MKILPFAGMIALIFSGMHVSGQTPARDSIVIDSNVKFERVEVEASYVGGPPAWFKFLTKTMNSAVPAGNKAPAGAYTVVVQFVVNKDGSISDFKALTNHGYGMEQEVIRTLRLSGKWVPAMQNGRPVRAYRKQPITFRVELDGMEIDTETPNTLYINKDNPVTIKVDRVKDQDLLVTVSQGTVTKMGNGQYIIKISKPERAIIRVYHAKKGKEISSAIYDVK